jgi:long-chain acyl-CoA synthetase
MSQALEHPLQALLRHAQQRPSMPFLIQPHSGGQITRWGLAETLQYARQLAQALVARGIEPGDRVAIFGKNSAGWLVADWAIWFAGAISVPLYPTAQRATIETVLRHAEVKLVLIGKLDAFDGVADAFRGLPQLALPLAPESLGGVPPFADLLAQHPPIGLDRLGVIDAVATLIYTSGTTGAPKGVVHPFRTLAEAARISASRFPVHAGDRLFSYLPLAHAAERCFVEANALAHGIPVYFAESLDCFVVDLQRARPTVFLSVPRLWAKFREGIVSKLPEARLQRLLSIPLLGHVVRRRVLGALGLDRVRIACSGGSPLPPALFAFYQRLGLPIVEAYGMSENFGISHTGVPGRLAAGTVGEAFAAVEARISDAGEVLVRSPTTMLGYYRDDAQTRERLDPDGWLHTGDRGALDAAGRLRITGRLRDSFKTAKAKLIWPAAIEMQLLEHPAIENACVCGDGALKPIALISLSAAGREQARADAAAFARALGDFVAALPLDPHEQPGVVVAVGEWSIDSGLLTDTMKIKRHAIEARYADRLEDWLARGERVILALD